MPSLNLIRFRLRLRASMAVAVQAQPRCGAWCRDAFPAELADLCARLPLPGPERAVVVERLALDLGELPLSRLEAVLQQRLLEQLRRRLLGWLGAGRPGDGEVAEGEGARFGGGLDVSGRKPERQAARRLADAEPPSADALWEACLRYLDTGYAADFMAWGPASSPDRWLLALLARPLGPAAPAWRAELAWRCLRPRAVRRLTAAFHADALHALCGWLLPAATVPRPAAADWPRLLPLAALAMLQREPGAAREVAARHSEPPGAAEQARLNAATPAPASPQAFAELWGLLLRDPPAGPARAGLLALMERQDDTGREAYFATVPPPLLPRLRQALKGADAGAAAQEEREAGDGVGGREPAPAGRAGPAADEPLPAPNAGIVLLWPMLPALFRSLELCDENGFVDEDARRRAVALLDVLAWGEGAGADWRLPASRLLCGLPPLPTESETGDWPRVDEEQRAFLDDWLAALPPRLPGLQKLSQRDLRALFLQRPGELSLKGGGWRMTVEPEGQDVLLSALPWPLTMVVLPWMTQPLSIDWRCG
ncbi:contractile injection system tape measure protein [Chromobacterium haemolyticum]|uniref:contractile injection system tape measure protein n=1 Tax=Chromobacterium haemolyticum TaxID=394935 RepID=UPI00244C5368|nr:contractile injection system tape measure protein [Chromobacterium haemolyticum]MDH0342431.1 contractile injection system tape measure protein [Chromobacterium haemolyticum]